MENNPRVFVSYSYDDQRHADKVLEFSNRLRSEGIDCILDQYEECPSEGWPLWMDKEIKNADFVLMICTETYNKRVMNTEQPGKELGVKWEGKLIYQHIYNANSTNKKFIPVLFPYSKKEDIPTPLQPYTYYNIDNKDDYEKLYWRLRRIALTEKPPLGILRDLPKKERKTDIGLLVTGFINLDLWNKAEWKGIAFLYDEHNLKPPWLGILFKNKEYAEKIFQGWHRALGPFDSYNELRISIVEGDVPDREPGYFVNIGANLENVIKHADDEGISIPKDYFIFLSRVHRMNPPPDSKNLFDFKESYKLFGAYHLIPVIIDKNDAAIPLYEYSILKRNIELRHISDIKSKNDYDAIFIPKYRDNINDLIKRYSK